LTGPRSFSLGLFDAVALCPAKNAEIYLNSFITHHLDLGVKHVVILDNGSTDGTVEIASRFSEVTVLQTDLDYTTYERDLREFLRQRFAQNRWSLLVDADELFDYPFSQHLDLGRFLQYLEENKYTAVLAYMLDMVSDCIVGQEPSKQDQDLKKEYPYYDLTSLRVTPYSSKLRKTNEVSNEAIKLYWDGIRKEVFGHHVPLYKHPLVLNDSKVTLHGAHKVKNARIADVSGVLFHYKFAGDWVDRLYNTSAPYKEIVRDNPGLRLKTPNARRLTSTDELLGNDFLVASKSYEAFVQRYSNESGETVD